MSADILQIKWLGKKEYHASWQAMREFTDQRNDTTPDEIWLLEHPPVYTQGQSGKPEHLLNPTSIPVIQTDRGGQITYHGPGQLMVYTLIDLKRKKLTVRGIVSLLEQSVIDYLQHYSIDAYAKREAPGVYIRHSSSAYEACDEKICSIGLRIRRGCTYHGIAFNICMDLGPFANINPCGCQGLKMTQLSTFRGPNDSLEAGRQLINYLIKNLGYTTANFSLCHESECNGKTNLKTTG